MRKISLTQNKFAIVDNVDYQFLSQFKWRVLNSQNEKYYAVREIHDCMLNGKKIRHCEHMSRVVLERKLGIKLRKDQIVDHINRIPCDNRRSNLRISNSYLNSKNHDIHKNNTSGVNGVYFNKEKRKYHARITNNYKVYRLGYFKDIEDARKARKEAEELYWKI